MRTVLSSNTTSNTIELSFPSPFGLCSEERIYQRGNPSESTISKGAQKMGRYFQFLRSLEVFSLVSDEDLNSIDTVCQEEQFGAGEVVLAEGSTGEKMFIVYDGMVEIWKAFQNKERVPLGLYGPGRIFGELSLIDHLPRNATVLAKEPTRLLAIDQADFNRIFVENAAIAFPIIKSAAQIIRKTTDDLLEGLRERNTRLEKINEQLNQEVEERRRAQAQLEKYRDSLEDLVKDRTNELERTNVNLRREIDNRKQVEGEQRKLVDELQAALSKVKTLSGLIPVCSSCKKIRDDKGYWKQIDAYLSEFSGAEFDSSMCPECSHKLYPKFYK
jgi:CRP-like cAMP-binding protein